MDNPSPPALFGVNQFLGSPGTEPKSPAPLGPQPNAQPLGGQLLPPQPINGGIAYTGDTLPPRYSATQLKDYIMRQLGYPVWNVELTPQQILDCINDALTRFSQFCPIVRYRAIAMSHGVYTYLAGEDCGMGVVNVDFMSRSTPVAATYGNLIDVSPLPLAGSGATGSGAGVGDFDEFQRWAVTYKRVFSIKPDWIWDQARECLMIHNPISAYLAGATLYYPYSDTINLPLNGLIWVKDYAMARATFLLGTIYSKFSGAIPGPVQAIQLDQSKRADAAQLIKDLEDKLFGMQTFAPLSID